MRTNQSSWARIIDTDLGAVPADAKRAAQEFLRELWRLMPIEEDSTRKAELLYQARIRAHERPRRLEGSEYGLVSLADRVKPITDALSAWSPEEAKRVYRALKARVVAMENEGRFSLNMADVPKWIAAHGSDPERAEAVAQMVGLNAPLEVTLEERLTQTGSQKVVFRATWTVADDPTDIVFKQLYEAGEDLQRELRPHPLSMRHPNVIETFAIPNQAREPEVFLVERRLRPLSDEDESAGEADAARLFVDVAQALAFLDDQGLVHGDVKPDNVGYADGSYILLDFGICRPAGDFLRGMATPTGSLRTRAPEVLADERKHTAASDVWALGATVFKLHFGDFPLFRHGDPRIPRLQEPGAKEIRDGIVATLLSRTADAEYAKQLGRLETIRNRHLRRLLRSALEVDPDKRPTAASLVIEALRDLRPLIGVTGSPPFRPADELRDIERFMSPNDADLLLLTPRERHALLDQITALGRAVVARRRYRPAATRLANDAYAASIDVNLSDEEKALMRSISDMAPRFVSKPDADDAQRVEKIRSRIEQVGAPAPQPLQDDLLTVLTEALQSSQLNSYRDFGRNANDFQVALDASE